MTPIQCNMVVSCMFGSRCIGSRCMFGPNDNADNYQGKYFINLFINPRAIHTYFMDGPLFCRHVWVLWIYKKDQHKFFIIRRPTIYKKSTSRSDIFWKLVLFWHFGHPKGVSYEMTSVCLSVSLSVCQCVRSCQNWAKVPKIAKNWLFCSET